jgi:hypothetical protein
MDRSKAPVFVLGSPRSGTTFLYNTILSSGNFAVYLAESNVFNQIVPAFGDLRSKANRARLMGAWLQSDYFKRTGLKADETRAEILSDCRNAGDFLRIVMERMAQNQGVERWAENTPNHLLQIPQIKATIPNALIIHIIRDGRDVAMSLNRLAEGGPGRRFSWDKDHGLLISGLYWEWIVRNGRKHGRRLGPDYLEVRFDELVQHPRETLKVLSEFIHHDLNYERIQQNAIGAVKKPNSAFNDSTGQDRSGPVGRWKGLGGVEAERLQALLGPLLQELGYEVSNSASLDFTAWRLRTFYRLYRDMKEAIKQSPFNKFIICKDCLKTGFLDQGLSHWKGVDYAGSASVGSPQAKL